MAGHACQFLRNVVSDFMTRAAEPPSPAIDFDSLSRTARFRRLCRLVCETTGIGLVFVDPSTARRDLLDYRHEQAPLCMFLRRNPRFAARCADCDARHLRRIGQEQPAQFYLCHAGLVDLVAPVSVDGRHIGSFQGGQVLPRQPTEARFRRFQKRAMELGLRPSARLRALYFATPWMGERRLTNLVELISLLTAHIGELGTRVLEPSTPPSSPVGRAKEFVQAHLREPFTLRDAGHAAGVAPSYLSALFRRTTGETFGSHVRRMRVERAKRLLGEPRHSLEWIAREAGFGSLRSLHRAFRQNAGSGPSEWRRSFLARSHDRRGFSGCRG